MKSSELRLKARQSLTGNYWTAVLAALIASFFGALVTGSGAGGAGSSIDMESEQLSGLVEMIPPAVMAIAAAIIITSTVFAIIVLVMGGVVQLGYSSYLLKQHDRQLCSIKDLFSQFNRFGRGFLQMFLRSLFTALWSLLFVIPGIVKSFSYAMTPFIMAENPQMTALQAITESKIRMKGHKWELFCLSLSFIGWTLLSCLTMGIGFLFLNPYVNAAYAAFYRDKIAPQAAPAPVYEAEVV